MIPKILSQTYKSPDLPDEASRLRDRWLRNNPSLGYRFYDDDASRAVVAEVVPEFLERYDAMPFPVMRADIFRYAVVHRDGGFYADIDMESLKPIPEAFFAEDCILSVEAHLSRHRMRELGYPGAVQIANCIFGARAGHGFFLDAIERAFELFPENGTITRAMVEDITGPRMLTRLFFEGRRDDIAVVPQIALMAPLHYPDLWPLNRFMITRHHTFGTWKTGAGRQSLSRRWIERNRTVNPFSGARPQPAPDFLRRHRVAGED